FIDEAVDYAARLLQAGVATELHVYPGAFHSFDGAVPTAAISRRFTDDYLQALRRALHPA
ncbi:MAG: esterase, partial [Nevskia sp.]|nr:esterase [Nevskia sp.]